MENNFNIDAQLKQWKEDGKHLPDFLKDFHDQKDFFKFLFESTEFSQDSNFKNLNFMQAQIFTIDLLLWRLASYGYTLQKNRSHQNFNDLDSDIELYKKKRIEQFNQLIKKDTD